MFYFHLWNIMSLNQYEQNLYFLQFMRKHSQFNILQIYEKINLNILTLKEEYDQHTYVNYLRNHHKNAFNLFYYQPYTVAKATL
jgi:hypothetical protein